MINHKILIYYYNNFKIIIIYLKFNKTIYNKMKKSLNDEVEIILKKIKEIGINLQKVIYNIPSDINENTKIINPTGDITFNIDLIAQKEITTKMSQIPQIAAIISEEELKPIILNKKGKYILTIDPIDGSSNVEYNGSCGTIFSLYKRKSQKDQELSDKDYLQKGKDQIFAGYIFYGSSLVLVYAIEKNMEIFQYNYEKKMFIKIHENFKIKNNLKYYCINEGYSNHFNDKVKNLLQNFKKENISLRYSGALIADIHRILISGGIFLYPSTTNKQEGKLRLMFENNPLAYIMKAAGGIATDGNIDVLEISPKSLHQTTPIFIGSNISQKYNL
ncbi:MAG: fructose-1,6-bisphosphatase [Bacteroidetes bacterium]|nr:fructose-1,6-bisphosphatase [Bacteroidota bacterium]